MKITKKELRKEAKLIKNYLQNNSYISDKIKNFSYKLNQFECQGKTIIEIMELLEHQIILSSNF